MAQKEQVRKLGGPGSGGRQMLQKGAIKTLDMGTVKRLLSYLKAYKVKLVLVFICILLSKIPLISTFIMYLGRHTLSLMLLNGFVIKFLLIPFYEIPTNSWFPVIDMGVKATLFVAAVIFPILISNLVVRHLAPFFFKYVGRDTGSPL